MRIFVGIPLSEELRGRVLEWEGQHRFDLSALRLHSGHLPSPGEKGNTVRWVEPKNLHVTLVPPLDFARGLRPSDIEGIIKKLETVKHQPFEIRFDKISFGPNVREPRMVWASGNAGEEIKKLKKLIEIALSGIVDNSRGRAFYQHVTLARIKNPHPPLDASRHLLPGGEGGNIQAVDWRMKVEKFVLYESHLLPQGADYEVLAEFLLQPFTKC